MSLGRKYKFNNKPKIALLASIIAVIIVGTAAISQPNIMQSQQGIISVGSVPTPPPLEIENLGAKASDFNEAIRNVQIVRPELPTYLPSNLVLGEIRTADAEAGDEITLIYVSPKLAPLKENEVPTIERHIKDGIVITIKAFDDDFSGWNNYVDEQVKEAPQVRSSSIIKGQKVLLIQNTPEYGWPYEAKIITDNKLIHAVSLNHDTQELKKVILSMIE